MAPADERGLSEATLPRSNGPVLAQGRIFNQQTLRARRAIGIHPAGHPVDHHEPGILVNLIEHPVLAPPCTEQAFELAAQGFADSGGVLGERT